MNCYNLDRFKNTVDLGAFVETLLDVMDEKASEMAKPTKRRPRWWRKTSHFCPHFF